MPLRSTLLACITALACVALAIAYVHKTMRYELVGNENGVFVLDRQTTLLHHCDKQKCNVVTPEGVSVEALKLVAGGPKAAEAVKK